MVLDIFDITVNANTIKKVNNADRFYLSNRRIYINKFGVYGSDGKITLRDGLENIMKDSKPIASSFDGDIRKVPRLGLISEQGWEIDINNDTAAAITYTVVIDWAKL